MNNPQTRNLNPVARLGLASRRRGFLRASALGLGLLLGLSNVAAAESLDANLNRLFESWRARNAPGIDACTAWRQGLDRSQQLVFLTITHRLTTSRLAPVSVSPNAVYYPLYEEYVPDDRTPLDHVNAVYSIAGGHGPNAGSGTGDCGGGDNNRLFMSMDHQLWLALGLANATSGSVGNPGPLVDPWNNRAWGESSDIAGPHDPFNVSDETAYGSPRGQVHFWLPRMNPERTAFLTPLEPASPGQVWRPGVEGVSDPYLLEMDQDYNWLHDSNPLCGGAINDYVNNHGNSGPEPIDVNWEPAACDNPPEPPGGADTLSPDQSLSPGHAVESGDGRFSLDYQGDGNLVLYQEGVGPIWASGTGGTSAGQAYMQADGNFVIYDGGGTPIWHTGTSGNSGAFLRVQNDGNVVIHSAGGGLLWQTGTCCH
jgi:hypothetical protein